MTNAELAKAETFNPESVAETVIQLNEGQGYFDVDSIMPFPTLDTIQQDVQYHCNLSITINREINDEEMGDVMQWVGSYLSDEIRGTYFAGVNENLCGNYYDDARRNIGKLEQLDELLSEIQEYLEEAGLV